MGYDEIICKLQRPILTSDSPQILVYNEDQSIMLGIPLTKESRKLFGKTKLKVYRYCFLDKDGNLHIGKRAEDQDW